MYYYRLYGLCVASPFEIPDAGAAALSAGVSDLPVGVSDLPAGVSAPDLCLTLGCVADFREGTNLTVLAEDWYYAVQSPRLFYMHCKGFDFAVADGSRITVDTHGRDPQSEGLVTYILGSAFGVAGIQRGLIPLHGAAVAVKGAAVIITGYSGSGKSAILSTLIRDGYRYLADDVCMAGVENGKPVVIPSYPQRKIAVATAAETGEDIRGAVFLREDGREKYALRNTAEWLDKKLPLSGIVELIPADREGGTAAAPDIRKITGHASLGIVLRNRYRPRIADSIGTPPQRMKQLLELTSSVSTYRVLRPREGFPVNETARMIAAQCF